MAKISDEVTAYFTANTTNLVLGVDRAKKAMDEFKKSYNTKVGNVKDTILDPGSLVGKGIDKLRESMKFSAVSMGALAAGSTVLVKSFKAANDLAGEQAEKMNALAEEMRRSSRVNLFASSADGMDSLADKLQSAREDIERIKDAQRENDPFGFGGGVMGNLKTVIGKTQMSIKSAVGLGPYNNFDQQTDAQKLLEGRGQVKAQEQARLQRQVGEAASRGLEMTRLDIAGGRLQVELLRTRADLEKKIADARAKGAATPQVVADLEAQNQLDRRMAKLRHRAEYGEAVAANLGANEAPGMTQELQRAQIARLGQQFQYRTALSRPGGMFKTESLQWQTKLKEADNAVNAAALEARKRMDAVAALRLELAGQREIVKLSQDDIVSRTRLADLDVRAAEAAREQAFTMQDYLKANDQLKGAVAARVNLEKTAVVVQRAQSDIAYGLALRTAQIESTNLSQIGKKAKLADASLAAMRAELSLSAGLTAERKRQLQVDIQGGENGLRELRQQRGFGKSGYQIQRALRAEGNRQRALDRFDARMDRDDGLINIRRDLNGGIESGIDMLTGERRAPSAKYRARAQGLQTGGLVTGSLRDAPQSGRGSAGFHKPSRNSNDQSAGRTAVDAARAMVTAQNISNQYLKTITEILPTLGLA